jgi:hypothetical protein
MGDVAIQDQVEVLRRRLVGRAAGEQIAVAGLAVQQRQHLVELRHRRALRHRLPGVVDREGRGIRRRLHGAADFRDVGQRARRQVDAHADVLRRIGIAGDQVDLVAQADGETAIRAEPRIGRGELTGAELPLQVVEPVARVAERGDEQVRAQADAGNAHIRLTAAAAC